MSHTRLVIEEEDQEVTNERERLEKEEEEKVRRIWEGEDTSWKQRRTREVEIANTKRKPPEEKRRKKERETDKAPNTPAGLERGGGRGT